MALVLSVLYMGYHGAHRLYYDYYFYARVKEHYIKPDAATRVMDVIVVLGLVLLMYLAYRLFKYALGHNAPLSNP